MATTSTLIVADDHPLFRAALREAVTRVLPQTQIVEAGSVAGVERAAQVHPDADLILLDLYMPDARGFSGLAHLRAHYPAIPVAIVSAAENVSIVRRAMDFGASGFIPKSASIERIGAMLKALLGGELAVPPEFARHPDDESDGARDLARKLDKLTPQQLRVLVLLAEGSSNKAIAQELDVSEATVKAHVTVILRKLGLERRTQAALLAQRLFRTDTSETAAAAGERDFPEA